MIAARLLPTIAGRNGGRPDAGQAAPSPHAGVDEETMRLVKRTMHANLAVNRVFRALLGVFGLVSATMAMLYTWLRGDRMVELLTQDRLDAERLLALSLPVVMFAAFAGLAAAVAWALHSRSQDELWRTLDTLSRLKREGEVAVSARALMFAFEEKLNNARRAFMLLLWFGRTLFLVCLGLFAIAAIRSIAYEQVDLFTVALGGTSVAASLLATSAGVPSTIKQHLADVIQMQSIVTACDRQISLLESDALSLMNAGLHERGEHEMVLEVQGRMGRVVEHAVELVERYVGPR